MEKEKLIALEKKGKNFDAEMKIPKSILPDINWWINNLSHNKTIKTQNFTKTIFTDASDSGWGATDGNIEKFGFWTNEQKAFHINFKELAVKLALETIGEKLKNCEILLRVDNTTALSYIN